VIARLLVVLAAGCALSAPLALAQTAYPGRPVRMLVGFSPGGTTDIIARLLAADLSEYFKYQFYVDNRPGATGTIASDIAMKAVPDGTTLIVVPAAFASNISVYAKPGYDPLRDFAAITRVAAVHNVLVVHPSVPAASVRELVELARRRPGELVFASPGHGSTPHLALEMLKVRAGGLKILHVPYRGMNPAVLEVIGGQVHGIISTTPPALAHVRNGRLRALGVASLKRARVLPEVPTFDESGFPGFEAAAWNAVLSITTGYLMWVSAPGGSLGRPKRPSASRNKNSGTGTALRPVPRTSIDSGSGAVAWSVQAERWQEGYTITSAPLYFDGLVVTGFAGGRPKATEIIGFWPALMHKDKVRTKVTVVTSGRSS